MAAGTCTISGAYHFNTTELAAAKGFIESAPNILSGSHVFVIPSGADSFYLGYLEGG